MIIQDRVYGEISVDEPVLLDLINAPHVQRLKKIEQYGVPTEWDRFPGFKRFEHCVGVMLLLRKLGASVEEQVAGLLHDVSHAAFSHVADWVMGHGANEDYQDSVHQLFLLETEIPSILAKYGFSVSRISDLESFSLLEQPIPDICVDRVDYALRELSCRGMAQEAQACASGLAVHNGKLVFGSSVAAKLFGELYLKCQVEHWGSYDAMLRYFLLSDLLKRALDIGIISKSDFLTDDESVVAKLKAAENPEIQKSMSILSRDLNFVVDERNPVIQVKKKFRYVDPPFLENGAVRTLSAVDQSFKTSVEAARQKNSDGIKVRLL